jgi:single-strand DNA-binding protein
MAGINKVILVGNLGKDPEVRHLEGGTTVANFTLATTEVFKDKSGNRKEQTEWHNIVVWKGLADIAEKYLKKGSTIYLEGRIRYKSYEKEGIKHYNTEILCDTFTILSKKENNTSSSSEGANNSETTLEITPEKTDDLPF